MVRPPGLFSPWGARKLESGKAQRLATGLWHAFLCNLGLKSKFETSSKAEAVPNLTEKLIK